MGVDSEERAGGDAAPTSGSEQSPEAATPPPWWRRATFAGPFALFWSIGVAYPLLGVFADSPEFLSAHRIDRWEGVAALAILCLSGPLLIALTAALINPDAPGPTGTFGRIMRQGLILATTASGFVAGLAMFQLSAGQWWIELVLATVGAFFAFWWANMPLSRGAMRWLGLFPVAIMAWFVFATQSGSYLRNSSSVFPVAANVGSPKPVALLIFDEFPVDGLMNSDQQINAARFPNFARLAAMSTWYPYASSVSGATVNSVPAILSGELAKPKLLPVGDDHPTNIVRLLSGTYDIAAHEAFARFCTPEQCKIDGSAPPDPSESNGLLLEDSWIVWQRAALPVTWTEKVPTIDQTFVDFASGVTPTDLPEVNPTSDYAQITQLFDIRNNGDRPMMWMGHFIFPHRPWSVTENGTPYAVEPVGSAFYESDAGRSRRISDRQRFEMQLGAADLALGRVLDSLEADGTLDDAMIVVTADHGFSFAPGMGRYPPNDERIDQVTSVPLFIKMPGQESGVRSTAHASTMDIVPTIVSALDVEVDTDFAGVDLATTTPPAKRTDSFLVTHEDSKGDKTYVGYRTPRQGSEITAGIVERMNDLVPTDGGFDAVFRVGRFPERFGVRASSIEVSQAESATWAPIDSPQAPVFRVRIDGRLRAPEVVAVRDGQIVGVGLAGVAVDAVGEDIMVVTDETLADGDTELWASSSAGLVRLEPTGSDGG